MTPNHRGDGLVSDGWGPPAPLARCRAAVPSSTAHQAETPADAAPRCRVLETSFQSLEVIVTQGKTGAGRRDSLVMFDVALGFFKSQEHLY